MQNNNVKVAVITAQHNIYERCLSAAASQLNIPVIMIQHGSGLCALNPELLNPHYIAVFSEYYQQLLVEQNVPKEQILVTGPLIFDDIYPFIQEQKKKKNNSGNNSSAEILLLTVPFVEQNYFSKEKHAEYIKKIIQEIQKVNKVNITIKLHPLEKNLHDYQNLIHENKLEKVNVVQKTGASYLYQLMSQSDIIINFSSTVVIESIILDKPVITMLGKEFANPFNKLISESKATLELKESHDLPTTVTALLTNTKLQQEYHKNRRAFSKKMCGKIDGQAAARVAEFVKQLARNK